MIKGKPCYRYYANGIHLFEPEPDVLRHARPGERTEISWRMKLPYPLISMEISGEYVLKSESDSLEIQLAPLFFEVDSMPEDSAGNYYSAYLDTLNHEPFRTVRAFSPGAQSFTIDLRGQIDPVFLRKCSAEYGKGIRKRWIVRTQGDTVYYKRVYQGYILRIRMKGNARLNSLRVESVFQHNMFALPQLEPGVNRVTVTTASPSTENLKVGFGWMDQGKEVNSVTEIQSSSMTFPLTVRQAEMPRMRYMWLGNVRSSPVRSLQ
jgi:hypothetical protein